VQRAIHHADLLGNLRAMAVPRLSDGVVTLRAHTEDDVVPCLEQSTDPLSRRWTRVPVPYTLQDARRFIRDVMPGGWASDQEWGFAVEAPGPDGVPRYAGTVSLRNEGPGRAEIAYGAHPWARGTGHVDRALRVLLGWGFSPLAEGGLGLQRVVWWAEVGNWASRRAAWRLGFSCDGTVRQWMDQRDALVDCWVGTLGSHEERAPRNAWLDVPRIQGATVTLRALHADDGTRIVEACSDERTAYWLGRLPSPYTADDAAAYLLATGEQAAAGTGVTWAVADPDSEVLLGAVALFGIGQDPGTEVGYWAHPAARGRGAVTEAVGLAVRHAFVEPEDGGLGLDKLRVMCAVGNEPSARVAAANGFREVGLERAATTCRDGRHDAVVHDLLPADLGIRASPAPR
jgi:RimJ/RimL family protein N-acetyltransferase